MKIQAKAAARNEYVIDLIDWGFACPGFLYAVMPLCAGGSLKSIIADGVGVADAATRLEVMRQLAAGVAGLHADAEARRDEQEGRAQRAEAHNAAQMRHVREAVALADGMIEVRA